MTLCVPFRRLSVYNRMSNAHCFSSSTIGSRLGHKPILQLIQDGRAADAVDYLGSISGGFVG